MDIQFCAEYKGLDFVVTVEDYDYQPAEKATRWYPGCPEVVEVTAGYVQFDGNVQDIVDITGEEMEVIVLMYTDNAALFDAIMQSAKAQEAAEEAIAAHKYNQATEAAVSAHYG